MRIWSAILLFSLLALSEACSGTRQSATPPETFTTYVKAFKQKSTTAMKLLLSNETIKMHEQEAKAQAVTVDDIVKRETLFNENQRSIEYRNEKVDGDKATLEIKNSYGSWETVPFVREEGVWKIDKKGYADQMMQDVEDNDRKFDELINANRPPTY